MTRRAHGYLAVPTTPPPAGCQRPAVVAVNGHAGGSAWKMMNPDDPYYWYGDAYARRGYIVLALDISTRPVADRRGLYDNDPNGLDPAHGNGPHPSIKAPGFDADFEEEGERVWDAMRGLDYLLARSDVNPHQVLTTGLSLGGEVATIFGALEPRLAMSIPVGFSPDLNVMYYHGNDRDWLWNNADVREYVDTSDYHALTAPRPLIVETGKVDPTFSSHNPPVAADPPFAADKQVARRTRVAYNGGPFIHYLHYDEHHYHVGDINPTRATEQGVRVPTVIQPQPPGTLGWQSDSTTAVQYRNLFEAIGALLPPASCVTHFQVRLQSPITPVTAGSPVRLVVTALDNNGLPDAAYRGTVHFQSTDAAATLPADYTFTAADHGIHTITVTLRSAGSHTVTATAGGRPPIVGSVTLVVHPAAASHFEVQAPATTSAGAPFSMTITARDPFNNVATGYRGSVTFSSNDGQATLPGNYGFTATDNGVHTFVGVILRTAGNHTVSVRDLGAGFTASATVVVNPAAASRLEVNLPASATAGAAFDGIVAVRDPYNNVATGYRGTVSWSSDDAQASLPANYTFTVGDAGVHLFHSLILRTAGNRTATVRDTVAGLTTSTHMTVSPAAASQLILNAPTGTVAGTAFSVTVTARDAFQNLATGYRGTVRWSSDDGHAVLPPNYTFTASDAGVHTFTGLVLRTAGNRTITITDTVSGSLTRSAVVLVAPANASTLAVSGFPSAVTAGVPGSFSVSARDAFGNVATGYRGTITFRSSDGQASLPGSYSFTTADSGVHTFSATLKTAGTQSLTATDTVTAIITGTQAGILVNPALAATLVVANFPSPTVAGVSQTFTVTARDPYGNTAVGYTGTVHFTTSDPQGMVPNDYAFVASDYGTRTFSNSLLTAGTQSLTATDTATATITGTQAGILVTAAPADHFDIAAPAGSVAGQPFDVTVTARDPHGNVDVNYLGTVTFTSADAAASLPADYAFTAEDSGVHTFSGGVILVTAGDQDVTATDTTSGITGTAIVTVAPAAVDHFQVIAPAQVTSGAAFDVTLMAVDPYGNLVPDYTGTVTFTCTDQDPNVMLPSDYTFTTDDGGMQTFPGGVTLITVGDQTLTVLDSANQVQGSALVTVNPAGPAPGAHQKRTDPRVRSLAEGVTTVQDLEGRDLFFATGAPLAVVGGNDSSVGSSTIFTKPAAQEGGGLAEIPFHRADRDLQEIGDFLDGVAAEETQIHDLGLALVQGR
jgi:hypothetical protein